METEDLLWEYQSLVVKVYKEQGLDCLSRLDESFLLNGREIFIWYNEVMRKSCVKHKGAFYHMKVLDDILFCSDELLYFTGLLYLHRPYINNPIKDAFSTDGGMIYPNFQNLYAKRFSMFADIASQKAYNYWDRLGDVIASFFPERIKSDKVFFPSAIEAIPDEFRNSPHYIWLNSFKQKEYVELNKKRKRVVHYFTSDTDFKYSHLEKGTRSKEEIEALQAVRESLPDFYKAQIGLTLEGFEKTLLLLEEISATLFVDIA